MKLKLRVGFALAIVFILTVSFKILQPVIDADNYQQDVNENSDKEGYDDIQKRIKYFLSVYDVDWESDIKGQNPWQIANSWVFTRTIHPNKAPEIGAILKFMSEAKITHSDVGYGGTQLKLTLTLEGHQRVVFKPKWYERDYVVEGKPYDGRDRHNAEILAFHLNRLLGFRRSPLVVGRVIDLKSEIVPVAEERLLKTFFQKGADTCFYGKCLYCKSKADGVCAEGSTMEGSLTLWLPHNLKFNKWKHPWRRTYRDNKHMQWEVDNTYCGVVKTVWPYNTGPRLMDIIDAAVFDYLIGNADRHHYETFKHSNDSIIVMLDNAKSLGNPFVDERTILAPLYQCCQLRHVTWTRLKELTQGVLTTVLDTILSNDPIAPVVAKQHFVAMDRRLMHIIRMVEDCVETKGSDYVFVRDIYSNGEIS